MTRSPDSLVPSDSGQPDSETRELIRAWWKAGVMEEGKVTHPDRVLGTMSSSVVLGRYADNRVLLARTEPEAKQAWERLPNQFAALLLVVNQEKSRLTTGEEGFAFLGFEFRKPPRRLLYMWPRQKACQHIRDRVREGGPIVSQ